MNVTIGAAVFGSGAAPVISGPCSVEPDYVRHAQAAADAGADVLRGCVFKPRSGPDRFQGMGLEAIPLLDEARARTGLPILSEPLDSADVEALIGHVDAFLIGARSMRNARLLQAVGAAGLPVVLKRSFAATYDEWLGSADYIRAEGNPNVILCERGIRTFITETRNTLDIAAVPVLRTKTELPVIIDPSHAAGRRDWVLPLALAGVAVGADGLVVESHPVPDESWTDCDQAIDSAALRHLIETVKAMRVVSPLTPAPVEVVV
ncbi:3-deoxy-D-arabinoheptulosonate-7-phosphate synthase [Amycolatopsis xylanica]|uniref:3-deoxy-D-arabinoheptulosonate-7-phosphate synthase n=1 Tax=Amycolatopsis xylanica TaxID=589385 RepID=A0A1H3SCA0_9PSEU|nr:3-deoxy-7-phosphoheptulonate synthase [Amycolatopsis xylanica]SDZ35320.1 3-deoxy-D-arabinoheptulosonate-7-phosphate synthase [Amycolatopsis xylanica]